MNKEEGTVKAKQTGFWIFLFIFLISSLSFISCSKKAVQGEGSVTKPSTAEEEAAARKRAQIQEPSEPGLKEKTLSEEEARRMKEEEQRMREASEKARFESEDIQFEFDQYILSDTSKQILDKKVKWLKDYPSAKAQIEGHCDERGSAEYNLALGQKRADAVMQYLVSLGINANRLSTISYGKEKPLDPGHTEEAWAKNRRAHLVLK
jgi:peptidoglycan-associated lipoprotein